MSQQSNDIQQQQQQQEEENLDLFLSLIESRLRTDFTSSDLSRLIMNQGSSSSSSTNRSSSSALPSGNASSPAKFLTLICAVFHRAAKPIKLRILLSVLGLESDDNITKNTSDDDIEEKRTDALVWKLLELAERDDEKWVRIAGGILKGKLFSGCSRGDAAQRELVKTTDSILTSVKEAARHAASIRSEASSTEGTVDRTKDSLIGRDACPTFLPYQYSLLSAQVIKSIAPEVDENRHFTVNTDASIFKVDAEVEEKRADEEEKEIITPTTQQRSGAARMTDGGNASTAVRGVAGRGTSETVVPGRVRGRFANGAGRDGENTGSSFLRTGTLGRGATAGRMAGRSGTSGRLGSAGRLAGVAGRGRAAALIGQTPLHRKIPGSTRAMLNNSARSGGDASKKMKMIDAAEVEGLTRAQNEREKLAGMSKAERRKKLLEDAAASGLRNKKPRTDVSTASSAAAASATSNTAHQIATTTQSQQNDTQAQPSTDVGSLLEKSNKLSDQDRQRIHEFFRDRSSANPHPVEGDVNDVWRVKLDEERTVDPTSGENVKETLYLELDYRTRQYKKTKKVKRK